MNITGREVIAFTVDETGKLSNYRVKQSLGYNFDQTALKAVMQMTGDWLPGILNGKPVSTELEVPINFSIGTEQ